MTNSKAEIAQIYQRRILEAAEALFAAEGFERVTVDRIAKAADVSKRTLYAYYPSKESIYHAIVLLGFIDLRDLLHEVLRDNSSDDFARTIETVISAIYDACCNNKFRMESALRFSPPPSTISSYNYELSPEKSLPFSAELPSPKVAAIFAVGYELEAQVAELILRGQKAGQIRLGINPRTTGLVLWASLSTLINLAGDKACYLASDFHLTQEEFCRQGMHLILEGVCISQEDIGASSKSQGHNSCHRAKGGS